MMTNTNIDKMNKLTNAVEKYRDIVDNYDDNMWDEYKTASIELINNMEDLNPDLYEYIAHCVTFWNDYREDNITWN